MSPEIIEEISPYQRVDESSIFRLYGAIIRRLRGPDGCPWDRKQTLHTLRRYIIEESFELITAIHDGDYAHVSEELGDVILVVFLIADALEQESGTTLSQILNHNAEKLIRRHPHVFGDHTVSGSEEVVANWNAIKEETEGRSQSPTSVSAGLPPLERAQEIQKKAAKLGFDWNDVGPAIAKVREELSELESLICKKTRKDDPEIEKEIGDLIFSAVNVSRHLQADASIALERSNHTFLQRFRYIELQLKNEGKTFHEVSLNELDTLWNTAKEQE